MNVSRASRFAGVLISVFFATVSSHAQSTSVNSGSLGAAGNGVHTPDVILDLPGAVAAGGDLAAGYSGGARTTVQYLPQLNPPSANPFTIEFWAKPAAIVDDVPGPAPLFNRVTNAPRSGWVFFQRSPTTGWNFRMYDGNGTNVGFDLTGGSNALDTWSHVVAVWNGANASDPKALLYVDGALADNTSTGSGIYNSSTSAILSLGSYDDGNNPFTGSVDEMAFYPSALNLAQIQAHFAAASSPTPGLYSSLVMQDGALEYLQNIPEPSAAILAALGLVWCGRRRAGRSRE